MHLSTLAFAHSTFSYTGFHRIALFFLNSFSIFTVSRTLPLPTNLHVSLHFNFLSFNFCIVWISVSDFWVLAILLQVLKRWRLRFELFYFLFELVKFLVLNFATYFLSFLKLGTIRSLLKQPKHVWLLQIAISFWVRVTCKIYHFKSLGSNYSEINICWLRVFVWRRIEHFCLTIATILFHYH